MQSNGDTQARILKSLIAEGEGVLRTRRRDATGFEDIDSKQFAEWRSRSRAALQRLSEHYSVDFSQAVRREGVYEVQAGIGIISACLRDLTEGQLEQQHAATDSPIITIRKLCDRFHLVGRRLGSRHGDRSTLEINDEYDVQDLFHSLLHIWFEDIRPEEWTPSYAGANSRVDFLLKNEKIIIEIKKTRKGLRDKQVGEELIIDSQRYRAHPDCGHLVCFVYDPEGKIANPRGLEHDLTTTDPLPVFVFVRPI